MKKAVHLILLTFSLTTILQGCDEKQPVVAKTTEPQDIQFPKSEAKSNPSGDLKTQFIVTIADLRKHEKDGQNDLPDTPDGMVNWIGSKGGNTLLEDFAGNSDKEIMRLSAQLKKELVNYQVITFPKIRKAYWKLLKDIYWHVDIDIKMGGVRNTELTFIGRAFAANEEKQKMMESINAQVIALRFKRANFKWIPDDDNYTFYKIDSPGDNVIE